MNQNQNNDDVRRGWTSASAAAADALCPGRHIAQRGMPDDKDKNADFGQAIHRALGRDDAELKSLTLEQREVFDACRDIEKKVMRQYFGENHAPMRVWREQRYWCKLPKVDGDMAVLFEHSGTPDMVARVQQKALIVDYKTLAGDVQESPRNQQLRDLAVLVRGHLLVDEVATVIVQPFVTHSPEVCIYLKEDLVRAEKEMFNRVRLSNNPDSPRIPGDVQCKWCRAKTKCVEYQRWAGAMVPQMLSVLEVPFSNWSPEQRAFAADRLPTAQKWLDELKEFIMHSLEQDPASVPGFCLKDGATRETITDPQTVFDRFSTLGGQLTQFMGCISVTKGKLKEAVNEVTGEKGKALDGKMKSLLEGLVESKQNKPSLVRKAKE